MSGTGPRLLVGEAAARRELEHARELVLAFAQLVQISRFHEADNSALDSPREGVSRLTGELCAGGASLHVLSDQNQLFVNRRRVRFSTLAFQKVADLVRLIERVGFAGFEIERPLSADDLREFLKIFHGVPREVEDPSAWLEAALAGGRNTGIRLIRPEKRQEGGSSGMELPAEEYAALLYAKAVVILRESLRSWEDEDTRRYLGARAKRVVQQMIGVAERNPRPFLWLVNVKESEEHLYTHSANVCLLSILIGIRMGMKRLRTCDLGLAALFHDMGWMGLPPHLLGSDRKLTEEDRRLMSRHPIHGVNHLLRLGALNETLLRRMIVVFEHNIDANRYPRESWDPGLHLFSRIVAIADAYDAMTTRRSFRPARTPDEAMREIADHAGTRYDADLVKVFQNVVGLFPLGTLVRLDTGEGGLVFHVDPSRPRRPLVKLVWDAEGMRLEDGPVVDLSEQDESGAWRRSVAGTDDAARHGIHVPSYLMEGGS